MKKPHFNLEQRELIRLNTTISAYLILELRMKQLLREYKRVWRKYYISQWREPKRFLYKGWGITFWKWCMVRVPLTRIHFGKYHVDFWGLICNGIGFGAYLPGFCFIICPGGGISYNGFKYFRLVISGKTLIVF